MSHWSRFGGGVHCSVCGVEFANVFARNAHMANHTKREPLASDDPGDDVFTCGVCGQVFATLAGRNGHLTTHRT